MEIKLEDEDKIKTKAAMSSREISRRHTNFYNISSPFYVEIARIRANCSNFTYLIDKKTLEMKVILPKELEDYISELEKAIKHIWNNCFSEKSHSIY